VCVFVRESVRERDHERERNGVMSSMRGNSRDSAHCECVGERESGARERVGGRERERH